LRIASEAVTVLSALLVLLYSRFILSTSFFFFKSFRICTFPETPLVTAMNYSTGNWAVSIGNAASPHGLTGSVPGNYNSRNTAHCHQHRIDQIRNHIKRRQAGKRCCREELRSVRDQSLPY